MNTLDAVRGLVRNGMLDQSQEQIDARKTGGLLDGAVYADSIFKAGPDLFAMLRTTTDKCLVILSRSTNPGEGFAGDIARDTDFACRVCPMTAANAAALRRTFPWTAPISLAGRRTTFGCGDRLGRATAGHLRAARRFQVAPVLAQQSMRELTLTGRTFRTVLDDVTYLVFQSGYTAGFGADADHLKTLAHIEAALEAGMTMITLDLSEVMRPEAAGFDAARIDAEFDRLAPDVRQAVDSAYSGRAFPLRVDGLPAVDIGFAREEARRCAVMYTAALDFARDVYRFLCERRGAGQFDLEISIDETTTPTLPAHHLFFIRELQRRQVEIVSMAPRFIGEFQKGIDYIGDIAEFRRQFTAHAVIAQTHGDYKISVHSGSDKFSIFPIVGEITRGRFHEKTAGTSWLEAVRLAAHHAPALYRTMHEIALRRLPDALKLYHITPDLAKIPPLE